MAKTWMKHTSLLRLLVAIATVAWAAMAQFDHEGVVTINSGKEFATTIKGEKPTFVKFYAPWCGHCKKLAPTWGKLAAKVEGDVTVAQVDCTAKENTKLCSKKGVKGYPTLKMFANGKEMAGYNGARDLQALVKFAREKAKSAVGQAEL